nr:hypothetical protein [Tanacetum cinerariifolium]
MNCTELLTQKTDLFSFIRTADPTKVRVAERQRAKDEPRLLETTVRRSWGDGKGVDIQPVITTTDTIVEDVAPLQPRRQRKRKTVVADANGPSHPPKKLREDYGALGGDFAAELEEKSPADSVTGLNLQTIGALQRFVISLDSSHHSGTNIAEAEVDSIVRSSAPAIATVTTVTAAVDAATTANRVPVEPSLFGVSSSSTGRTDFVPGGFSDVSGSDFLMVVSAPRICREMLDEFSPPKFFASIRRMDHDQHFTEFNIRAARQISLSVEVRMRAEYNIREKRRLRSVIDKQAWKRIQLKRNKSEQNRIKTGQKREA